MPFGSEYASDAKWGGFQRAYIRLFGVVDLPTRVRAGAIRQILESLKCDKFLDYGAGTGVYSYFLSRNMHRSGLAVDIDQVRVQAIETVARCIGRPLLKASAISESQIGALPKGEFDIVLAVEVLMCVRNPETVLYEFRQILTSGGALIVHVPITASPRPYERTRFNDTNIPEIFEQAGFENIEIHRTFGPAHAYLCDLSSVLMRSPMLLALIYPFLLLAITLLPPFNSRGSGRLIIARNSN
jgi:SAM-dependent methyltransferase